MRVTHAVGRDALVKLRRVPRRNPHVVPEPVPRNMPVGVHRANASPGRLTGLSLLPILPERAALGTVGRVSALAVVASAFGACVGADRAVHVRRPRFDWAEHIGVGHRAQQRSREIERRHLEQQIIATDSAVLDKGPDLRRQLAADRDLAVLAVLRVILDQEALALGVVFPGQLDDHTRYVDDPGAEVKILRPQFG